MMMGLGMGRDRGTATTHATAEIKLRGRRIVMIHPGKDGRWLMVDGPLVLLIARLLLVVIVLRLLLFQG